MNFIAYRKKIKNCNYNCKLDKNDDNLPIFFECKKPEKVKYLVITEQPKISTDDFKGEGTFKNDLRNIEYLSEKSMIKGLVNLLGSKFKESVLNDEGEFYWTHHTKCPSRKKIKLNRNVHRTIF